jgi:hypothetical protein
MNSWQASWLMRGCRDGVGKVLVVQVLPKSHVADGRCTDSLLHLSVSAKCRIWRGGRAWFQMSRLISWGRLRKRWKTGVEVAYFIVKVQSIEISSLSFEILLKIFLKTRNA